MGLRTVMTKRVCMCVYKCMSKYICEKRREQNKNEEIKMINKNVWKQKKHMTWYMKLQKIIIKRTGIRII